MKAKNLEEAKALVDRYESITLKEIEGDGRGWLSATILTGFGTSRCTLCIGACSACFYITETGDECDHVTMKKHTIKFVMSVPHKIYSKHFGQEQNISGKS